jgi:hypothetical protein
MFAFCSCLCSIPNDRSPQAELWYYVGMGNVLDTLQTEGTVITQAPWSFVVCIAALGAILFTILRALKRQEIKNLLSTIALKDVEILDYRRKLTASPEEAKSTLQNTERQRLLAYRELAWIAARFVVHSMNLALTDHWHDPEAFDFQTCRDAIRKVPVTEIDPPQLIEFFVAIDHYTTTAEDLVRRKRADVALLTQTRAGAEAAMASIDAYIARASK